MAGASNTLHEAVEALTPLTRDLHRALVSVQEELEAVDWYRQRADAATDPELREILLHNMREEMEHASMLLEWLRRREPYLDTVMRTYLFTEGSIISIEAEEEKGEVAAGVKPTRPTAGLTIGTLKGG